MPPTTPNRSCKLCSMPYYIANKSQTQRPLKLCQKIAKNCSVYLTEDDLGDDFSKFDCRRTELPFCSRCFVTTEKLSQLNDQLEDIRSQITDLVESFKSEILKSREILDVYNSASKKKKIGSAKGADDRTEVTIKDEIVIVESHGADASDDDPFANEEQNDNMPTEHFKDLASLGAAEITVSKATNKRNANRAESSDNESNNESDVSEQDDDSGDKWGISDHESDEDDDYSPKAKKAKTKKIRPSTRKGPPPSNELYMLPNYVLKEEYAKHFVYKAHVAGSDNIILTCKYCHQDKRGGRCGDFHNFRRHLKIKHASFVDLEALKSETKTHRTSSGTPARRIKYKDDFNTSTPGTVPASLSNHYKYKARTADTNSLVLTCNYCGQDKRGRDAHNFRRHLMRVHNKECGVIGSAKQGSDSETVD